MCARGLFSDGEQKGWNRGSEKRKMREFKGAIVRPNIYEECERELISLRVASPPVAPVTKNNYLSVLYFARPGEYKGRGKGNSFERVRHALIACYEFVSIVESRSYARRFLARAAGRILGTPLRVPWYVNFVYL